MAIYLKAGQFPERAPHPPRSRAIEPVLEYLQKRWEQGEHNGRLLFKEIRAQGYPAGLTEAYIAIQPWRTHGPTASLARAKEVHQYPSYSPKQTLWLLFKEHRTAPEERFVQRLLEQRELIAHTYEFVRRFRQILTDRDETALQPWAYEAEASQIPELLRFVQRVRLDWEAVENALLFASSQGQVEGQVNRLKVGHRDKAMGAPVLLSYKLVWWEQATSTASARDPILHRRVGICTEGWNLTLQCLEKPLPIRYTFLEIGKLRSSSRD